MNVDDDLLSDLLTDRASDVHADPSLLTTVRTRARRRQRTRRVVLVSAATAAVAVAATVAIAAPPGHGTGQATLLPGTGAPASTQTAPPFPLTPTHLPDGLGPARTIMIAGQTVLRYDPAGQVDPRAAITIQVGADTPAGVLASRPSTPATVDGKPAQVISVDPVSTTVVFTRQPAQVVAVTGNESYASAEMLLAVAASLTDRPLAATPPFVVTDLPATVGPVNAYDSDSMSFGTSAQSPSLSISYSPGIDLAPIGAAPAEASTATPPVARVNDSRRDGVLQLASTVLDTDQLLQLAPHVTITADAAIAAPTPAISAGPFTASPPSPTPGQPAAGPQPADPTAAADAVRAAFHTAFTAEPPGQPYASLAAVEGGSALHAALDQLRANYQQAVETVSVTTGAVVFTSPTQATTPFTLTYTGGAPYGTTNGTAVLDGGTWLVSRGTYCAVLAFGGVTCPTQ